MHALLALNFIVIKFNRLLCGISSSPKISGITLIFREPCVLAHALLAPNFIVIKFNRLLCGISSSQKISGITLIFREPCVFAHAPGVAFALMRGGGRVQNLFFLLRFGVQEG